MKFLHLFKFKQFIKKIMILKSVSKNEILKKKILSENLKKIYSGF